MKVISRYDLRYYLTNDNQDCDVSPRDSVVSPQASLVFKR